MSKGKTTADYLQDMLDYLDKAANFTSNGRDAFYADEMAQLAVIRVYEVIGEIVKRLPQGLRDAHPQIDWRTLAGFGTFSRTTTTKSSLLLYGRPLKTCPTYA